MPLNAAACGVCVPVLDSPDETASLVEGRMGRTGPGPVPGAIGMAVGCDGNDAGAGGVCGDWLADELAGGGSWEMRGASRSATSSAVRSPRSSVRGASAVGS